MISKILEAVLFVKLWFPKLLNLPTVVELLLGHVGNFEEHCRDQVDALQELGIDMGMVRLHTSTLSTLLVLGSLTGN